MASFTCTRTSNSVTIRVTGISSGTLVEIYLRKNPDPGYATYNQKFTASGTSVSRTVSGLSSGTNYAVNVKINDSYWIGTQTFTTTSGGGGTTDPDPGTDPDPPQQTVKPWSWYQSNGSATAFQTQAAYSAVLNRGSLSNFSYLVWNDMVNKVYEILANRGFVWENRYCSYYSTLMSPYDKQLTATRFNSLRFNIGSHYSTGIYDVSRGDVVYGWYFTRLTDCMNQMII